jgi:hypothetical protein
MMTSMTVQQFLMAGPLKGRGDSLALSRRIWWRPSGDADPQQGDLRPVLRSKFELDDQLTVAVAGRKKTTTNRNVGDEHC